MKIAVRKHKKDNLVTNIWKIYASVLVLSFLWNLGKRFFKRFSPCVSLFDFTKFKKFFDGIKTMFKGSRTDEKVRSLKVKAYVNISA